MTRPGGSPRKRARREAIERGEIVPNASNTVRRDRMTFLSEEVLKRVVTFVRSGNFIDTAAAAAGIARATYRRWLERGARELDRLEQGEEPNPDEEIYLRFHCEVTEAMALAEAHDVAAIRRAGQDYEHTTVEYDAEGKITKQVRRTERGDHRALTWRLEHMHGDKYTQKIKVEVEGQLSQMLDFLETNIPPESYRHVIEALAKWIGTTTS
jgi:hypothetical protein